MRASLATTALVLSVAFCIPTSALAGQRNLHAEPPHARPVHRAVHRRPAPNPFPPLATARRAGDIRLDADGFHPFAPALIAAMARHLGGNPTGWARAWCGRYLGMVARQLGFAPPRGYALAANWRTFGRPAQGPAPGVVVVWPHHVGVVRAVLGGGRILVRSGNHRRRVADGIYSTRGVIAWRDPA